MGQDVRTDDRQRYATKIAGLWRGLSEALDRLERLAADPAERLSDPDELDALPRLQYTEMVVLEAMRLYPPAYTVGREALHDCVIGGYGVPAGTTLLMSQWVLHRDPRYFDRPEEFVPGRAEVKAGPSRRGR